MSLPAQPHEASEPETPHLDFQGTTPYEDYVQADVLTHLQHPLSDDPGEMVFLVTTQVMELWFTVIVHEWETATAAIRNDDVATAKDALKRSVRELEALNASWRPLAQLTPASSTPTAPPSARAPASSRRCTAGWSSCSARSPRPCSSRTGVPPRPRRAGEGTARAEPLRRGPAAAGPPRPRDPRVRRTP